MSGLVICEVRTSAFSTATSHDGSVITVQLAGNADMDAISALDVFWKSLHAEALRLRTSRIVVDFRGLYFMNSASLKTMVTWIVAVEGLPSGKQYTIQLRRDPNLQWQYRTVLALNQLSSALVHIEG